jgi:hypothetical protein
MWTDEELESQAWTPTGVENAVWLAVWRQTHGEPDALAFHYISDGRELASD